MGFRLVRKSVTLNDLEQRTAPSRTAISLVLKLIWNRNLSVTLCFGLTFQTTV